MTTIRTRRTLGAVTSALLLAGLAAVAVAGVGSAAVGTRPGENGRIAFTRYTDATRSSGAVFTIDANGKGERRVTRPPAGVVDFQPDWSADGSRIVFERRYPDKPFEVFTIKADGSDLRQVDPGCPPGIPATQICEENAPAFSPNGRRIAFFWTYGKLKQIRGEEWIEVGAVGVMNTNGSSVRQLTQPRRPTSSEDFDPVWSPDGKRIAFVRLNSSAQPEARTAIFVVDSDGGGQRQLTPWRLDGGDHPDWSPDGKWILFRSASQSGFAGSNLYRVRPNGTGLRQLTDYGPKVEVLSASFSPDGRWIVFGKTGKGRLPDLFAIRPDGSGLRQITRTAAWDSSPDWGATG